MKKIEKQCDYIIKIIIIIMNNKFITFGLICFSILLTYIYIYIYIYILYIYIYI